ncbi:MAG: NgoFVII family restriction endonuclease [Bacteroidales bacterium]|nr:NgoFVII family restriction endonuclease [Bacteroidales bacterium]
MMHIEFISDSENLCEQFTKLCEQYECFEWAVAWASDPEQDEFSIGGTLLQYRNKIKRLVIGCHFYQTSPEFIKIFINSKQVKFLTQTDGTFHPKVYLFYNRDGKWAALVGSSNFTCAGFTKNSEANILLTGNKDNHIRDAISTYILKQWEKADSFTKKELKKYRDAYERQKPVLKKLSKGKVKPVRESKNWVIEKIQKTTPWEKYEKELRKDRRFKWGIKQLKEAHRLFAKCSFNKLTDDERKYLAGTIGKNKRANILESDKIDWWMFGTVMHGTLKTHINNNNKTINEALKAIPLTGNITKAMYRKYLNKLRSIEGLDVGPAVCSRLLAMKRPDFFVSLNKQSKPVISKKYGIPMAKLTADTYWDLIMKIHEDDWYRHPKNTEAKPYRMALMDCLIREWK